MRGRRRYGPAGSDRPEDYTAGEDRQHGPQHGTVGPAKREFPCDGRCWEPNRYGVCKVCGGIDPRRRTRGRAA